MPGYPCCCTNELSTCDEVLAFWETLEITAEIDPSATWATACCDGNEAPFIVPYFSTSTVPNPVVTFLGSYSELSGCESGGSREWSIVLQCDESTEKWGVASASFYYPGPPTPLSWGRWEDGGLTRNFSDLVDGLAIVIPFVSHGTGYCNITNTPNLTLTLNVA